VLITNSVCFWRLVSSYETYEPYLKESKISFYWETPHIYVNGLLKLNLSDAESFTLPEYAWRSTYKNAPRLVMVKYCPQWAQCCKQWFIELTKLMCAWVNQNDFNSTLITRKVLSNWTFIDAPQTSLTCPNEI
jgi:hypothetical protein